MRDALELHDGHVQAWRAQRLEQASFLGGCPKCGGADGLLNIFKDEWAVCRQHGFKWWVGRNWFSEWTHQTDEDWERAAAELGGYTEVKPVRPEAAHPQARTAKPAAEFDEGGDDGVPF